jgi:hypothetical protein
MGPARRSGDRQVRAESRYFFRPVRFPMAGPPRHAVRAESLSSCSPRARPNRARACVAQRRRDSGRRLTRPTARLCDHRHIPGTPTSRWPEDGKRQGRRQPAPGCLHCGRLLHGAGTRAMPTGRPVCPAHGRRCTSADLQTALRWPRSVGRRLHRPPAGENALMRGAIAGETISRASAPSAARRVSTSLGTHWAAMAQRGAHA